MAHISREADVPSIMVVNVKKQLGSDKLVMGESGKLLIVRQQIIGRCITVQTKFVWCFGDFSMSVAIIQLMPFCHSWDIFFY